MPALSLYPWQTSPGSPPETDVKKLKSDFPSQQLFFMNFLAVRNVCFFFFTRHPANFAAGITFVPRAKRKCICIESTGGPLGFIENNCGNHSWKNDDFATTCQKSSQQGQRMNPAMNIVLSAQSQNRKTGPQPIKLVPKLLEPTSFQKYRT